jgi:hypothetical protein
MDGSIDRFSSNGVGRSQAGRDLSDFFRFPISVFVVSLFGIFSASTRWAWAEEWSG